MSEVCYSGEWTRSFLSKSTPYSVPHTDYLPLHDPIYCSCDAACSISGFETGLQALTCQKDWRGKLTLLERNPEVSLLTQ